MAFVVGPGHIDRVPIGRKPAGNARADAQQPLRARPRAQAHHHLLGNRRLFQTLRAAILRGAVAHLFRGGAQRQLAQHVQVALAEEVGQRLLHLFRRVDLSLPQTVAQLVHGDVDVHHFVGALEKAVGNGFADGRVRGAVDGVVQRFKVLDVDRGHHVDAGVQQLQHIFIALAILAAGHIGVGQLVHDHGLRVARDDRVHVHLFQIHAAIGNLSSAE